MGVAFGEKFVENVGQGLSGLSAFLHLSDGREASPCLTESTIWEGGFQFLIEPFNAELPLLVVANAVVHGDNGCFVGIAHGLEQVLFHFCVLGRNRREQGEKQEEGEDGACHCLMCIFLLMLPCRRM